MTAAASKQAAGDILGERYVLKREMWIAPLGPVWLARDRVLDRAVLVQLLAPALAADPSTARAFQKAAARVAQIGAPGLLQVYDIGDAPAFAVLEHASGGRLAERVGAGPMRPTEAARAALAIARALESLHERGTWHGSLSPSTVLFDEEGRAKVFAVGEADTARAARKKIAVDQPAGYATPEKDPIPADADRYALAALLYQMLTGSPPEKGVTAREKRRAVPPEIDRLLQRALAADPNVRPSLDEFEAALAPFARVLPPDVKEPRFAIAEFRWLFPVIIIVVLAILALTFGVEFAQNLGKKKVTPKTSKSVAATAEMKVANIMDFDPLGNRNENHAEVGLAIDGDPLTKWSTVGYTTQNVGGKGGVGLLFDLGSSVSIGSIRIQSDQPGWVAEIRTADVQGTKPADYKTIDTFTALSRKDEPMPPHTRARYVLLWITSLSANNNGSQFPWSADVNEVQFFAP